MGFLELARRKVKELKLVPQIVQQEVTVLDPFQFKDFKKQNIAVRIRSTVLEDDFWLVSNEGVREHLKAEGLLCYLPEEMLHMKNISPEAIKALHAIKKEFGGNTRIIG